MIFIFLLFRRKKLYKLKLTYELKKKKKSFLKKKQILNFHYFRLFYTFKFSSKFFKKDTELRLHLVYNIYTNKFLKIKKFFFNTKYYKKIRIIRIKRYRRRKFFFYRLIVPKIQHFLKKSTILFLKTYNIFFFKLFVDIFFLIKHVKNKNKLNTYILVLTFLQNKFFINLLNQTKKKNYFFLSTGLFSKYFGTKKSIKKNKILKILMAKYTRKILLVLKIKKLILLIKKNPTFLLEFLKNLNTPIIHKFFNPYKNELFQDNYSFENQIKTIFLFFLKISHLLLTVLLVKGELNAKSQEN